MSCTRANGKASTTIYKDFGNKLSCCAETTVFDLNGANAGTAHKDGATFASSAAAIVNIGSGGVKSVLHIGNQPLICPNGNHDFLITK